MDGKTTGRAGTLNAEGNNAIGGIGRVCGKDSIQNGSYAMSEIDPKSSLSPREREIAIAAIGTRVSGSPTAAAEQMLAGIAVLDGDHLPVLVWPVDTTLEEKAAWHEQEAANFRMRAARLQARIQGVNPSEGEAPQEPSGLIQIYSGSAPTHPASTSFEPVLREASTESPVPSDQQANLESSDAC